MVKNSDPGNRGLKFSDKPGQKKIADSYTSLNFEIYLY
jgi:hypothetical protein